MSELRNHAPWCNWDHEGPCPAENAPAPDHPVWAENERLRKALRKIADAESGPWGWIAHEALRKEK